MTNHQDVSNNVAETLTGYRDIVAELRPVLSGSDGGAELAERAVLDLADALGTQSQLSADLTQRLLLPVQAVPCAKHQPLAIVEATQEAAQLSYLDAFEHPLVRVFGDWIYHELSERPEISVASRHRLVQWLSGLIGGDQGVDLVATEVRRVGQLLRRGLTPVLLHVRAVGVLDPC
jgi:hypothetical protein